MKEKKSKYKESESQFTQHLGFVHLNNNPDTFHSISCTQ